MITRQGQKPRILLAEDDQDLRELLAQRLEEEGAFVSQCAHGLELAEKLERAFAKNGGCEIDVVITDIRMPGATGMAALAGLDDLGRELPIIVITAFADDGTHASARRFSARAVFDKPFDVEDLIACVDEILAERG